MKEKLLLFPFNGNSIEALDCIDNSFEVIGFIDDDPKKAGKSKMEYVVFGREVLSKFPEAKILAVPGSPETYLNRRELIESLKIPIERFAKVIHPNAFISSFASIGYNSLVMGGVNISATAFVGNHVCILPNTVIHHDSIIDDFTMIGSNVVIAGYTTIGQNAYIGSGSKVINNISVGKNVLVGMGSNVIKNIPDDSRVVGNPARLI